MFIYLIVVWLLCGYYVVGAHVAFTTATNRFAGISPSFGPKRLQSGFFALLSVLLWPLLLLLLCVNTKKGEGEVEEFVGEWMCQIKTRYLRPRYVDYLWPISIVIK